MKLKNMKPGDKAKIIGYDHATQVYRAKLLSMGLTRGTILELLKIAPMGDPVEIEIRGFSLSLRKDEAEILLLEKV